MRRSREIMTGGVIILALLASFLLLSREPKRPASDSASQPGFVTSSRSSPKSPGPSAHEERQRSGDAAESTQLPPASNTRLRRGADERFPAQLDVLVLDSKTHLPIRGATATAMNRATRETVAEQVLPEGRGTIGLPTGAFYLSFEHPDYQERGLWIEFNNAAGEISRQTIELRREVEVSGTVRDQNGAPVSGATILFLGDPRRKGPQIVTGADGKFSCRLPAGRANGSAVKGANRATFISDVSETSPAVINVTLPITSQTVSFTGHVFNQKAEPVEGAVIRVARADRPARDASYTQVTQEDGTFALTLPAWAIGMVSVSAAGASARVERMPFSADVERDFVIETQPAFTVTLLTPEGEALTKGFRVEGLGPSVSKIMKLRDGRYYSTAYPVDIRAVAAEAGYGNSEVVRLSAYEPEVTLRIEPGGNLSGRAVDPSGRPVSRFSYLLLEGHNLYLSQSLVDSPDGSFAVRHVAPGRYTVNIVADGYRMQGREIQIESGRDCFVEMILQQEAGRRFVENR